VYQPPALADIGNPILFDSAIPWPHLHLNLFSGSYIEVLESIHIFWQAQAPHHFSLSEIPACFCVQDNQLID
jgi:hypothetical protein